MTTTKTLAVELDPEIHKQFKLLCVTNNTTMAEVVRQMISRLLRRNGWDSQDSGQR